MLLYSQHLGALADMGRPKACVEEADGKYV